MKRLSLWLVGAVVFALLSPAQAASKHGTSTNESGAHAVGIITPDVATSATSFDYYIRFKDTGEFGVCSDGQDNADCAPRTYLTPEQFIAKFYPKATYVGFRLQMSSSSGDDNYLYIYMKKAAPPPAGVSGATSAGQAGAIQVQARPSN